MSNLMYQDILGIKKTWYLVCLEVLYKGLWFWVIFFLNFYFDSFVHFVAILSLYKKKFEKKLFGKFILFC